MRTVYVVKSEDVLSKGTTEVFTNIETRGFFAERAVMETRPDFQQIIPSFIIKDPKNQKLLIYQRKPKHTEERLAGMWTPVFGGHIDPIDWDMEKKKAPVAVENYNLIPSVVYNGLVREMEEETGIKVTPEDIKFYGFIKDDKNAVGKVHLGIIFSIDIEINDSLKEQIMSKTEINDILEVQYSVLKEFMHDTNYTLEGWAKLLINDFLKSPED